MYAQWKAKISEFRITYRGLIVDQKALAGTIEY